MLSLLTALSSYLDSFRFYHSWISISFFDFLSSFDSSSHPNRIPVASPPSKLCFDPQLSRPLLLSLSLSLSLFFLIHPSSLSHSFSSSLNFYSILSHFLLQFIFLSSKPALTISLLTIISCPLLLYYDFISISEPFLS